MINNINITTNNVAPGDTLTFNGVLFTFVQGEADSNFHQISVGRDSDDSARNLVHALNTSSDGALKSYSYTRNGNQITVTKLEGGSASFTAADVVSSNPAHLGVTCATEADGGGAGAGFTSANLAVLEKAQRFLAATGGLPAAMSGLSVGGGAAAVSGPDHQSSNPETHLKLFALCIEPNLTQDQAKSSVVAAIAEGGNVNASILAVENLLKAANEKHAKFVSDYSAFQKAFLAKKPEFEALIAEKTQIAIRVGAAVKAQGKVPLQDPAFLAAHAEVLQAKDMCEAGLAQVAQAQKAMQNFNHIIIALNRFYTPLHSAVSIAHENEAAFAIMEELLENGANPNAVALSLTAREYQSAPCAQRVPYQVLCKSFMQYAARSSEEAVKYLMQIHPALVVTPMLLAADIAHTEAIELLLEHGGHLGDVEARVYKRKVVETDQEHFDLLKWVIAHVSTAGEHLDAFMEAFINLLPNSVAGAEVAQQAGYDSEVLDQDIIAMIEGEPLVNNAYQEIIGDTSQTFQEVA